MDSRRALLSADLTASFCDFPTTTTAGSVLFSCTGLVLSTIVPLKASAEALSGEWNEYGVPMLDSFIKDRTHYIGLASSGISIFDQKCPSGRAEFQMLVEELKEKKWLS